MTAVPAAAAATAAAGAAAAGAATGARLTSTLKTPGSAADLALRCSPNAAPVAGISAGSGRSCAAAEL